MVLGTVGNLVFLSALGVAAGSAAGLVCAPVLLSTRGRSLVRLLGPTPSLPSNYVLLVALSGIPMVLLYAAGVELLLSSEWVIYGGVRQTIRSSLRVNYGLLLYVAALARLGLAEVPATDFDPVDAFALFGLALAYSVVAVSALVAF